MLTFIRESGIFSESATTQKSLLADEQELPTLVATSDKALLRRSPKDSRSDVCESVPWESAATLALLNAVVLYCKNLPEPIHPRTFCTNDMVDVHPLVDWPTELERTVAECEKKYTDLKSRYVRRSLLQICHRLFWFNSS